MSCWYGQILHKIIFKIVAKPNLASSFLIVLHRFSLKAGAGELGLWDCPISYIFIGKDVAKDGDLRCG
jgi:hypothetical protein